MTVLYIRQMLFFSTGLITHNYMVLTLEQTKSLLGSHKHFIKDFNMGMTMAHIKMQGLRAVSRSCSGSALSGHGRHLGSSWDEALHV